MQLFVNTKTQEMKSENETKLQALKQEINQIINQLYEEVAQCAMGIDRYRVPVHGIEHPELENPVNLF
jgi:hypothetical protein